MTTRTMVGVAMAFCMAVASTGNAQSAVEPSAEAQTAEQRDAHRMQRELAELASLYQGPELEQFFVDGQASLWLPGFWTFDHNHTVSLQAGVEVGSQLLHLWRHHLYLVGGLLISPQTLEQHRGGDAATFVTPWIGLRYIHDSLCTSDGSGCMFFELGTGLAFEITGDDDDVHHPPNGAVTALSGLGYRARLGEHTHLGARIDFAYLDDTWTSELAWITPTLFGGASF